MSETSAADSGATAGAAARAAAARAVARVVAGASLDDALAALPPLPERDASLARALAFGACRWHHRLEWQASRLLDRPLPRRETTLAALIRVGLLQLQSMRVPDHAAVSATVEAARLVGAPRAKGLVNAVLRRFLRERAQLDAEMAAHPTALHSHPAWLIERIRADWPDDWPAILDANNAAPPMWLRVNLARTTRERYLERLEAAGLRAERGPPPPGAPAAILLAEPLPTARLPGFAEGEVSVQDASAQLAAELLDLAPGQRVLDACAAPGGKTAHALERCGALAELWAVDRDASRLDTVRATLTRLGLTAKAKLVHGDAARPDEWWDGRPFDRVLLDAPCTALGVIRRHPDIKLLRKPDDVRRAAALQAELLAALWPLLRPGGRLVYATCTVLRAENGEQIERFLSATPDAEITAGRPPFVTRPGEANRDGFYYACIDKQRMLPLRGSGSKQ
ncbi:MAG TPA: 16S rRNA (cytosine(967)-C(5))-methyltransferase RsmB [Gammaproteobacteria bacterium]